MIEVTQQKTKLKGTKVQLMSEFCCLVNHLVTKHGEDEPLLTREELDECIEMATLSEDELHQKTIDALVEILGKFL